MTRYTISYDGFVSNLANNEEEAYAKANKYLSRANLINDGEEGEWYIGEAEEA